jgi:predicted ATP-binding protein involved in virulence
MIKSFALADVPFSLIPAAVLQDPSLNIFAADSMTLFVGPNGSGKTQTLLSLAEKIALNKTRDVQIDWRDAGDARSTFALYFTPIPYTTKLPPETQNFAALHPRGSRGEVLPDVETAIELASEFGFDPSPSLILSPISHALSSITEILLAPFRYSTSKYKLNDDQWVASWAVKKIDFDRRYSVASRKMQESEAGFSKWYDSPERIDLKKEEESIQNEMIGSILRKIGEDAVLKLRAFQFVKKEQSFTKNVGLELLTQLGLSPKEMPSKVQEKARERYSDALERLRRIRDVLASANLVQDRHRLDIAKWNAFSPINLSGIAELSLSGASSGSAALLDQFARLKKAINKVSKDKSIRNLILLIDEGDAFLHLEWQQQYVNFVDLTVKKLGGNRFDCIQVVLTTHSPVLMSDFPKDCIHRLRIPNDRVEDRAEASQILSFGAPLDAIVRRVGGAGTLGAFSARIMRQLLADLAEGKRPPDYKIKMIDDPVIQRQIQLILNTNNQVRS